MRNPATPDFAYDPHPRKLSRKGWTLLGVVAVIVIAIYYLVVTFYSSEGGSQFSTNGSQDLDGITLALEPVSLQPDQGLSTFRVSLTSEDPAISDGSNRAVDNIRLTVSGPDGSQEVRFPQGAAFGRAELVLGISGELAQYPFDNYIAAYFFSADFYDRGTGGVNESRADIPISVVAQGAINGWDSQVSVSYLASSFTAVGVNFDRAFSTKLFALVLIGLALIMSIIALVISLLVFSNRRKTEAALLAWTGSLLFALPILRTYLPGAPPIGAAIDIYIFLWSIVMSFLAVFFVAASWVGQRGAELEIHRPSPEHQAGVQHGA
jgi:uncharacterized membrane protein